MADVPPLHEQEAQGQFLEEMEKLVDGVIEDVRAGHLKTWVEVRAAMREAAEASAYAVDAELAADAVKYGVPVVKHKLEREAFESQVRLLARNVLTTLVSVALGKRPEIKKMPPK